jgi:hypothetical protein
LSIDAVIWICRPDSPVHSCPDRAQLMIETKKKIERENIIKCICLPYREGGFCLSSDHLLLDSALNLGPLISR